MLCDYRLLEYATNQTIMNIAYGNMAISGIASNPASEFCVFKWLKLNHINDR